MIYIFCPMIYADEEKDISETKNPNSISGHRFQCNLIRGLIQNNVNLNIYNIQRIKSFPNNRKVFVPESPLLLDGNEIGENVAFINLPLINYISQYVSLKKKIVRFLLANPKEKIVLIIFNTHYVQSKLALMIKKRFPQVIICNVIGDLYGKYGINHESKNLKALGKKLIEKKQELYQNKFDKYVLLTSAMREVLGIKEGNYTIVEGFYNPLNTEHIENHINLKPQTEKIIFYAGSLTKGYGIEHLLKAFKKIKKSDYRLYIAGQGDGENILSKYMKEDTRIKYFGFLSPKKIKELQYKSTVLISPRKTDKQFVKYSFPSKTFECLASGKPYIAHRLPCEPDEYSEYIQYPSDETDESLKDKIMEICEMGESQRNEIGSKAKHFIITTKNTKVMCKKIVLLFLNVK